MKRFLKRISLWIMECPIWYRGPYFTINEGDKPDTYNLSVADGTLPKYAPKEIDKAKPINTNRKR